MVVLISILYCLFSEQEMLNKGYKEHLPRPTLLHHTVEDFLTIWDAQISHILPLRRYLENVLDYDMRNFYSEECTYIAMTAKTVPHRCESFLAGEGLTGGEYVAHIDNWMQNREELRPSMAQV